MSVLTPPRVETEPAYDLWNDFAQDGYGILYDETNPDDAHRSARVPCRLWRRSDGSWTLAAAVTIILERLPLTCAHFYLANGMLANHPDLAGNNFQPGDDITFRP